MEKRKTEGYRCPYCGVSLGGKDSLTLEYGKLENDLFEGRLVTQSGSAGEEVVLVIGESYSACPGQVGLLSVFCTSCDRELDIEGDLEVEITEELTEEELAASQV
jgi:hypothetical protein